jgi:hypothetical protein
MVETTLEMISSIDKKRFPSHIIKEYYETIRELMSVIMLMDGYKTYGEGAHKETIAYTKEHYTIFEEREIVCIEELRSIRNKIAYDGFFITEEYLVQKEAIIVSIINKLKKLASEKILT